MSRETLTLDRKSLIVIQDFSAIFNPKVKNQEFTEGPTLYGFM